MRTLFVAIVLMTPVCGSAQSDDAYRGRVQEAVAEFDAHRFEEARALFRQAHEISPNARTLRGIGLASFEMGDYVEAYLALSRSLSDSRRELTQTQRGTVQEVLARARRFIGLYALEVSVRDAEVRDVEVTVDGSPAVVGTDGRLVLALGSHTVRAQAARHRDAQETFVVRGGEEETLSLNVTPVAQPAAGQPADAQITATQMTVAPRTETSDPAPPTVLSSASGDPILGVATLALGGTFALGALVLGPTWWLGQNDEIVLCEEAGADCHNSDELAGARDVAAGTTVAVGVVGAVGLIVGAVLLSDLGEGEATVAACAPFGAGVVCGARF